MDQAFRLPTRWSRADSTTAWGAYRHTVAYKKAGKGAARAVFRAELPRSGSWELELHLCHKDRFRAAPKWGTWQLAVSDRGDTTEVEFDAETAPRGWSQVGRFELAAGEVTVTLSDATEGQVVVADAIRWVPQRGAAVAVTAP